MATPTQTSYITDLAVRKTKEFKEVKELLVAQNIVSADSQTVMAAGTINDICNAITDQQASKLIDALLAAKEPARSTAYAQARVQKTVDALDGIKSTIAGWSFE